MRQPCGSADSTRIGRRGGRRSSGRSRGRARCPRRSPCARGRSGRSARRPAPPRRPECPGPGRPPRSRQAVARVGRAGARSPPAGVADRVRTRFATHLVDARSTSTGGRSRARPPVSSRDLALLVHLAIRGRPARGGPDRERPARASARPRLEPRQVQQLVDQPLRRSTWRAWLSVRGSAGLDPVRRGSRAPPAGR